VTRVAKRDYYELLGLTRGADEKQIRRAFHALARELHPDVSDDPDAGERFREVAAAYSVLSKPSARFLYDRFGYRGRGSGGLVPTALRKPRILAEVEIDTLEAELGTKREVQLAADEDCELCGGTGAARGSRVRRCETCAGTGRVRLASGLDIGRWLQVSRCHECSGLGRIYEHACPECEGVGRVTKRRALTVRIPPGVSDGARLRVAGEPQHDQLLVRVLPGPVDSRIVRWAATVLLVCAVALLVYFVVSA
jgi:molecular chaperone DnaJ